MDNNSNYKIKNWSSNALINSDQYKSMYNESINKNEDFWSKHGKRISWTKPYTKIKDVKYSSKDVSINWFYDGTLNVSYNCI